MVYGIWAQRLPSLLEDVTMWYDAAEAGRVMNNLPDVLLFFRRNDAMMKRRSREKAWSEFWAYNDGTNWVYGKISYKHLFSFMRLCFRLMPTSLIRLVYNSKLRRMIARQTD